jgi:hypothetical protein
MYFTINRPTNNEKIYIEYDKSSNIFDRKPFIKYADKFTKQYMLNKKNKKNDNTDLFENTISPKLLIKLLEIQIGEKNYEWINFVRFIIKDSKSEYRYTEKPDLKLNNIVSITVNETVRKGNLCHREKAFHNYNLFLYLCCFRHLNLGGNLISRIWHYCHTRTIEILYLGLLLFKKITVCWGYLLYFEDFNPIIKESTIIDILDNDRDFIITYKPQLYELIAHITKLNKDKDSSITKLLNKTDIFDYEKTKYLNNVKYLNAIINKNNIKTIHDIWANIYKPEYINFHKEIKLDFAPSLEKIIIENGLNKCLELNMNFGFTSLCILNAIKYLENSFLIVIDENQQKIWNNIGVKLIQNSKRISKFKLIDDSYTFALSKFRKRGRIFNLIMIDGWSFFEDTLYYIIAIDDFINVGGFICIENAIFKTVGRIMNYINTVFKHYKLIYTDNYIVIWKKIKINNIDLEFHISNYQN